MTSMPENWTIRDGKLRRVYEFPGFAEAFAFMTRCAFLAERANHHPDWRNVHNRVEIELHTHDAGSLTEKDHRLARAFEAAYCAMTGGCEEEAGS